ncbi:isochorismatase hydrolase [Desulfovibrio sp. X2]|uniref:cysteine hydrolase family protein n=1 Tax=Desulfovibrio sp. X2 TaxID=941449 RepID=UPI000358E993|nr:isochorismatase family protein [Desulfovibrio sp. X2]EPR43496.1 isochorismatase hydrolase [Desulfovibrio sp. X2]
MPITKLDRVAALIVVDLQNGITAMPTADPAEEIVARAARLAEAFRARGLPVVLVNVTARAPGRTEAPAGQLPSDPKWFELVPELAVQPGDLRVTKQCWGAFLGSSLDEMLRGLGATQVVLCGISTSVGVESTARSAYDLGYNVALVTDAMTDRDPEAHANSVARIFPRLGETASTDDVLRLLELR